jgi:alanyl-tRNA synthetase
MTNRLYYHGSFVREFEARVISCIPAKRGGPAIQANEAWSVVLDRTAFYPTSGGQPHDTGRLGDANVTNVFEREDDAVVHVTDRPLAPGLVRGSIDWPRRFDHMQQHTGSHLLSAVFLSLYEIPAVSFHLGRDTSTIDLATASVSPCQLEAVERRTNELICEDLPVTVRFGDSGKEAAFPKVPVSRRNGIVRTIEVEGIDIQPCGGTHVIRTGQVGMVLLRRWEKAKGNSRLEFICGERARRAARADFSLLQELSRQLSCKFGKIPSAISRLVLERDAAECAVRHLREDLAALQAQVLLAKERAIRSSRHASVVAHVFENHDAEYLRLVAFRLVTSPGTIVLLASRLGGHMVFAQAVGAPANMNMLLREVVAKAGGKGGGSRNFAQGSVCDPDKLDAVLRQAVERLSASTGVDSMLYRRPDL